MWFTHKTRYCNRDVLDLLTTHFLFLFIFVPFAAVLRPLFTMTINSSNNALAARAHIQDGKGTAVHYWGYATRYLPCTNDAGSCEYLDSVYGDHEKSMIYTFIMWAVFGIILLAVVFLRLLRPSKKHNSPRQGFWYRSTRYVSTTTRRYLIPECSNVFKYTTRLQVLILAILCAYLLVFS